MHKVDELKLSCAIVWAKSLKNEPYTSACLNTARLPENNGWRLTERLYGTYDRPEYTLRYVFNELEAYLFYTKCITDKIHLYVDTPPSKPRIHVKARSEVERLV